MARGRLLVWCALFAVGIASQGTVSLSPGQWLGFVATGAVTAVGAVALGRPANFVVPLLIVAWGGFWCAQAEARLEDGLDPYIDSGPVVINGVVVNHPESVEDLTYVVLRVRDVAQGGKVTRSNTRLRLTVVNAPPLSYGDVIQVRAELRRPSPATNPGAFDYRKYLHRQGITATAFVAHPRHLTVAGSRPPNPMMYAAGGVRELVRGGLNGALSPDVASVAGAVVLGDRRPLSADTEEQFRKAGVSHLLTVSGLHVGFFVLVAFSLLRALRLPPCMRTVIAIGLVWTYVLATGSRPPAVRAGIMATFGLVAAGFHRKRHTPSALTAGALCLLVHNPLLLFDTSFQLSFAATGAIVWGLAAISQSLKWLPRPLASTIALTAAAQIGVLPLLASTFQQLSMVGFVGSVIGSPIVSLLVPVGVGTGLLYNVSTTLGGWAGTVTTVLVSALVAVTRWLASLPWAFVDVPPPPPTFMAGWWLLWWAVLRTTMSGRRRRQTALVAVALMTVSLWLPLLRAMSPAELTLVMMDVGQGDAILIHTPEGVTALVDGGGNIFSAIETASNPGLSVILPYLRYKGIGAVDVVINTHPHEDHLQGLLPVIAERPIALTVDSGQAGEGSSWSEYLRLIDERSIVRWIARPGYVIRLGEDTIVEVLHPSTLMSGTRSDLNNNSVVLRVVYGGTAALLTGDIEVEAQQDLISRGVTLRADVLKVPHHGSRLALMSAFYEAVGADTAVITVGRNNYGHPSAEVIAALEAAGAQVYRTDVDGAVKLTSDGTRWTVRTVRTTP